MTGQKLYSHISREIRSVDYERIDAAIELFRTNAGPADYFRILQKTFIDRNGELWVNPAFVVRHSNQQMVDYAFWNIIALAPVKVRRKLGITARREQHLSFRYYGRYLVSPHRMTMFPAYLYLLKVKTIDAIFTDFEQFPEAIRRITGLRVLKMSSGRLRRLPDWIGELTELEHLELRETEITALPESFRNLVKLKLLTISNSSLSSFPKPVTFLPALEELDLHGNRIPEIPAADLNCAGLVNLDLCNNELLYLPAGINRLSKLRRLYLSENRKLTTIHPDFALLHNLETVFFERCMNLAIEPHRKKLRNRENVLKYQKKIFTRHWPHPEEHPFTSSADSEAKQEVEGEKNTTGFSSRYRIPAIKEEMAGRYQLITALLKSGEQDEVIAGMRLLTAAGDPVLAEACLSVFPIHEKGSVLIEGYDYEYTGRLTFRLTDILNELRDFPNLLSTAPHSWRRNLRELSIMLDENRSMPNPAIFPGLRKLSITCGDEGFELKPEGWDLVRDLNIGRLKCLNLLIDAEILPNCRRIQLGNVRIGNQLLIHGLPLLEEIVISDYTINNIRITGCPKLKKIHIHSNSNFLSVSDCQKLNDLTLTHAHILRIVVRNCPALNRLYMQDIWTRGVRMAGEEFPSLKDVTYKKIKTPENIMSGVIPDFINQLPALVKLDLSGNALSTLPEFRADSGIQHLDISDNHFNELPEAVYKLRNLQDLEIGLQAGQSGSKNSIKQLDPALNELPKLRDVSIVWPEHRMRREAWKFRRALQAKRPKTTFDTTSVYGIYFDDPPF